MELPESEVFTLVQQLLPGFLAAWIFYSLTAHPKPSPFERVIQALIFTVVAKAVTLILGWLFVAAGRWLSVGRWTNESEFLWSVVVAFALGLSFARSANNDGFHSWLRRRAWTPRTSYPSEWYSAFSRHKKWLILHLSGQRRLYGWPEEWPDQPDKGHFVINQPEWLLDDGSRAPLHTAERVLLPVGEVQFVEFLKDPGVAEQLTSPEELARVEEKLIELHKGDFDGSQSTAASSVSTGHANPQ